MTVGYLNDEEFAGGECSFAMGISDICFQSHRKSTLEKRKLRAKIIFGFFLNALSLTLAIFLEKLGITPYDLYFWVRENDYFSADEKV